MTRWFWLSILISCHAFAQTDTIQVNRVKNYFPHIAQYQQGEIPYFLLCDSLGLQTYDDSEVKSFEIAYWSGSAMEQVEIIGNQIPDSICTKIGLYSLGQMLFITKIKSSITTNNETVFLHAMNLIPILKEDE